MSISESWTLSAIIVRNMKEIFIIYKKFSKLYNNNLLIERLFSFLTEKPILKDKIDVDLFSNVKSGEYVDAVKIIQLIGLAHQKTREAEKIINTNKRKHLGIYYTDYAIAKLLSRDSLAERKREDVLKFKFYEPCVGTGLFIFAYIDEIIEKYSIKDQSELQNIVNNIYFSDIDTEAIDLFIALFPIYIKYKYKIDITIRHANYYKGDVLFDESGGEFNKVNIKKIFSIDNGFDIILTNPPYKLLKANSNKYKGDNLKNEYEISVKKIVSFIKEHKLYRYNKGTLNLYRIFLEEILENYSHHNSRIGVIIPITLLNDKQSELLRKRIINHYKLLKLYIIPEKNDFFDVCQAFCFFVLDKSKPGNLIKINPRVASRSDFSSKAIDIDISHIKKVSDISPIVIESEIGWEILKKINGFPKLGSLDAICNARGELDLTLDKDFITKNKTTFPLIKGSNVKEFSYSTSEYFTEESFIHKIHEKHKFVVKERIVCQQISNIHLEKRLKFTKIPGNIVLGNSCNFLTFHQKLLGYPELSLDYLLGILNSLLLNWRFKVTNSNNHISNHELSELPIVIPTHNDRIEIEGLVDRIKKFNKGEDIYRLNMKVFSLYNLNQVEADYVLGKHHKTTKSLLGFTSPKNVKYDLQSHNVFS